MRRFRIGATAITGAALGLFVGLAYTAITLFQFDRNEFSTRELLVAGLVVAVPVATVGGFLVGWAWSILFERPK